MTYEELLTLSDSENLIVKEKELSGYGGRIYKNRIAINRIVVQLSRQKSKLFIMN